MKKITMLYIRDKKGRFAKSPLQKLCKKVSNKRSLKIIEENQWFESLPKSVSFIDSKGRRINPWKLFGIRVTKRFGFTKDNKQYFEDLYDLMYISLTQTFK
jgi:hypothetical protein